MGVSTCLKIPSANTITASMRTSPAHNDVLPKRKPSEFSVNLNMYEIKIETRNKSSVSPFKILI